MTPIKTTAQTRAQWLTDRQYKIGGSTIAAILGLDKYRSPVDVWMDLTGKSNDNKAETKVTLRGHLMEQTVANYFEHETGKKIIQSSSENEMYTHSDYPYIVASPDRRYWINSDGDKGILECKTTRLIIDEIRDDWFTQLMWYLGLTGYSEGVIAWFQLMTEDFFLREFELKREFFDYLINEAVKFWDTYVKTDTPPPITRAKDVDKLFRKHIVGKTVLLPEDKLNLYIRYGELNEKIKELDDEKIKIQDELKMLAGDAEGIECDGKLLFTYKARKDKEVFDSNKFSVDQPELYKKYIITIPGPRSLLRKN